MTDSVAEGMAAVEGAAAPSGTEGSTAQPPTQSAPPSDASASKENGSTAEPPKPALSAPEKYEFKAPEGVKLDDSVVSEFSAEAKRLNLSQEDAQNLINKLSPKIAESQALAQQQARETAVAKWGDAAKSDKEFGGEKFDANVAIAKKAVDAFATPELKQLLEDSGLGSHPEILRTFYRMGKKISEDGHVSSSGVKPSRDLGTILYDKS